jgi:AbrB family looped-hinge helix DNA binding protein
MGNTDADEQIVSVTERGQATIPKRIRERLGIHTPGRVKFVEDEEAGEVFVRPVESISEFRGVIESNGSARELLDEARAVDRQREERLLDRDEDA